MPDPTFPEDDAALVAALQAGDARAWSRFLDRYERLIYAVPRRMGLSAEDAADVFQDVVVALLRGLPRMRDAKALPRWLVQTSWRIARDRRARARRLLLPGDDSVLASTPDPAPDPSELLADLEGRAVVQAALAALEPRCRGLLELLFLADPPLAYVEVARRLGLPIGSLGPTRGRCLERLLDGLEARGISRLPGPTLRGKQPGSPSRSRRPR